MLKIKRVYEDPEKDDGYRILVDRLWARGETKVKADLDDWVKEIAPSTELRKSFGHAEAKYDDFQKEYMKELDKNDSAKNFLKLVNDKLEQGNVTLLYSAKNEVINNAVVLKEWIEKNIKK